MYSRKFIATKVNFIETSAYDPVYIRPFKTEYTIDTQNAFYEATEGGRNLSPLAFDNTSGLFLKPSAIVNPNSQARLVNGFGEKRFAFMIECKDENSGGLSSGSRYIITGYTDHMGVVNSHTGRHMDPNMQLYINNLFQVRDVQVPTHHGISTQTNLAGNYHVLSSPSAPYGSYNNAGNLSLLRPEEVFQQLDLHDNVAYSSAYDEGVRVQDTRNLLSGVRLSDRKLESRGEYISRSAQAYMISSMEEDESPYSDRSQTWESARSRVRDTAVNKNPLLSELFRVTGYGNSGYVSYSELNSVVNNLDHIASVIMSTPARQTSVIRQGQGESWAGSTHETIVASMIQQIVPALMSDCLLTGINFVATNETINGVDSISAYGAPKGFTDGIDYSPYIARFYDRLRGELLSDISMYGHRSYSIDVSIDMLYESRISISIDGGPRIDYFAPSFCDSLYAPILTDNANDLEIMASDMASMLTSISDAYNQPSLQTTIDNLTI